MNDNYENIILEHSEGHALIRLFGYADYTCARSPDEERLMRRAAAKVMRTLNVAGFGIIEHQRKLPELER